MKRSNQALGNRGGSCGPRAMSPRGAAVAADLTVDLGHSGLEPVQDASIDVYANMRLNAELLVESLVRRQHFGGLGLAHRSWPRTAHPSR